MMGGHLMSVLGEDSIILIWPRHRSIIEIEALRTAAGIMKERSSWKTLLLK